MACSPAPPGILHQLARPRRGVVPRSLCLLGRNGTGKSTLLKAIASYEISGFPQHLKVVHVEQDPRHDLDASPLSTVLGYDPDPTPTPNPNHHPNPDPNPLP